MRRGPFPVEPQMSDRHGERGAAIILALMVALVLVFLGMGLPRSVCRRRAPIAG